MNQHQVRLVALIVIGAMVATVAATFLAEVI